jgi:uncharacterized membrane protein
VRPEVLIIDIVVLVQAVGLLAAPGASRRGIFFGSMVDPAVSSGPSGRRILMVYRRQILVLTGLSLFLANSGILRPPRTLLLAGPPQVIGGIICIAAAARKTREMATTQPATTSRTASLEVRRPALPGGWLLFLGPLMIPLMSGILLWSRWDAIPEKYPIHWGFDGQPDGWMMKTFASVFGVLLAAVAMTVLLLWMAYYIFRRTRQVSTNQAAFIVEKRIGIGWTLNLGNRWSWFFSIMVLSIPLILLLINRLAVGE